MRHRHSLLPSLAFLLLLACSESLINQAAFQPTKGSVVDIDKLPPSVKHIYFPTPDGERLSAFWIPHHAAEMTFLYFHGNAGNASQRLALARQLNALKANVLLVDYRGYGLSSGEPSEEGVYTDAQAALALLIGDLGIDQSSIFVYGRSLGSAVALDLATHFEIPGLILVTPISSGRDLAEMLGVSSAERIVGDAFDNLSKIKLHSGKILIIAAELDQVLPAEMALRLRDAANTPVEMIMMPDVGHNNITRRNPELFYSSIREFCQQTLLSSKPGVSG